MKLGSNHVVVLLMHFLKLTGVCGGGQGLKNFFN